MTASRYLNLPYIWHSLGLKSKGWESSIKYTKSPYEIFSPGVRKVESKVQSFEKIDAYLSLNYMNFQEAKKNFNDGLVHMIMQGLSYYNQSLENEDFIKHEFLEMVDNIIEKGTSQEDRLRFIFDDEYQRFDLKGIYTSGIVQAKAASLFIRAYNVSNDDHYLRQAEHALFCLLDPIENLGTIRSVEGGMIWAEEYPSPRPSMVLNGHVFVLIAIAEYLAIQNHEYFERCFQELHCSTISYLPYFKQADNVLYSMYRWDRSNVNYMGVHAFQFYHLFIITAQESYKEWAIFSSKACKWKLFAEISGIEYRKIIQRIPV